MINQPEDQPAQAPPATDPLGRPERINGELLIAAVARIVPGTGAGRRVAAERFVAGARISRTDLSRAFAIVDRTVPDRPWVRQACLAIPGAGRTAMLLVSSPIGSGIEIEQDALDRAACVRAAAAACAAPEIAIVQTLPSPEEPWAVRAAQDAGFLHVGDLAYLERPLRGRPRSASPTPFPPGMSLRPVAPLSSTSGDRVRLERVLERSYAGTLDCPELCGLRSTADILDSHLATAGEDPRHWYLLFEADTPIGCVLLAAVGDSDTAELVYLGLAPEARGRGLGRAMLENAMLGLASPGTQRVVCAVDRRNVPAARLYESLGFIEFASRRAFVRVTGQPA
ncbi:MAG: GNAT family N-acetyltransferase [Phycisphaerales bacterium]